MLNAEEAKTKSDILIEFLEVAFHSILYYREIYPKSIFSLKKKYQVPIHVSIHPELNSYITMCLKAAHQLLQWDGVQQIALVILSDEDVQMEKFCFDLTSSTAPENDHYFIKAEETFRQYLLKLSVADLKELPEDCTFRIQITTKEDRSVRLNDMLEHLHFPWIDVDEREAADRRLCILPIKTLETNMLCLNMYVER